MPRNLSTQGLDNEAKLRQAGHGPIVLALTFDDADLLYSIVTRGMTEADEEKLVALAQRVADRDKRSETGWDPNRSRRWAYGQ